MEEYNDNPSEINRKRKFQAEHKCWDRVLISEYDSPTKKILITNDLKLVKPIEDDVEIESEKDSNSFEEDMDYSSSAISSEEKVITASSNTTSDRPFTLSVNGSNDFGLYSCLNYDEQQLTELDDCDSSVEHKCDGTESLTEKELEEMLYANAMPKNYVLASGKWSFNKENQGGDKKLTIDKEFEEYFSMLML